jgi:hypothetical protein
MQILSNWQLTFDPDGTPLVLVAFGQLIEAELAVPWQQQAESRGTIRGTHARRYSRGNAESGITITSYKEHADDEAARLWCLQNAIALDAYSGVTAKLLLEISGSTVTYELAAATLDGAESAIRIAPSARTQTRWTIGGTAWTEITP